MASPVWTLTCVETGVSQTLAQWGITRTVKTVRNFKAGELALTFVKRTFSNESPLLTGQHCIVLRDAVQWFAGKVYAPNRSAAAQTVSHVVTLKDAFAVLESVIYMQSAGNIINGPSIPNTDYYQNLTTQQIADNATARQSFTSYGSVSIKTPYVTTGTDDTSGLGITSGATVTQMVNFAIAAAPGVIQLGSTFVGVLTPREQANTTSVAELIRRVTRWTPDVVMSMDYSTTPPTLNFLERGTMATRTLVWGTDLIETVALTPRYDIFRSGVQLFFFRSYHVGSLDYQTVTPDAAGTITNPETTLTAKIDLDPITIDPNTGDTSAYDPLPTGMAARMLTSVSSLFYDGSLSLVAQDLALTSWLSQKVNISGASPESAAMNALVQQAVETVESGTVQLTLGAPPQLSVNDVQALNKIGRVRIPATLTNVTGNRNGGGGGGTTTIAPPTVAGTLPGNLTAVDPAFVVDMSPGAPLSDYQKSVALNPGPAAYSFNGNAAAYNATSAIWLGFGTPVYLGTDSQVITYIHLNTAALYGQLAVLAITSGSLDLTGYSPANYKAARLLVNITGGNGSFPYSDSFQIDVTAGLGKKQRISINPGSIKLGTMNGVLGCYSQGAYPTFNWEIIDTATITAFQVTLQHLL